MPTPAVFPTLVLIAGVATGVLSPWFDFLAPVVLIVTTALAVYAWHTSRGLTFAAAMLSGFYSAGLVLGSARVVAAHRSPLREFFDDVRGKSPLGSPPVPLEGVIRQDAAPAEYGASMTVDVLGVQTACGWLPAAGGLRVAVAGTLSRDRLGEWRAGRRVRLPVLLRLPATFRDPGVGDEAFAMMRRGIALIGSVKSGTLVEVVRPGHAVAEFAATARAYVRRAVAATLPDRPLASGIITAILVGDRGGLTSELERRLQEAGTYHVIAISGGNVAILAGLALFLLRLTRVPRRAGSLLLAAVICAYGYVAGGGASVARATVAAAVYLVATAADHRSPALNVLAIVALVAVLYEPLSIFDPGLLLSYGATLALLIAADRITYATTRRARSVTIAARGVLFGTLIAELALFPIGASIFHRITLAGLLLNFVAIPLMTLVQVAGIALLLLFPASASLAHGVGTIGALAAEGLTRSTVLLELAPWLAWRVPAPPGAVVAAYYAGWAMALLFSRRSVRRLGAAVSALSSLLIAWPALADTALHRRSPAPGQLRVTFLDVGQGDSILLQFPGGTAMLVDAAGLPGSSFDLGERVITPAMLSLGVRRLQYLAITHGDPDHVEGAPSVVRDFSPLELWEGVPVPPHPTLRALRDLIARGHGSVRLTRSGDHLSVGPVELRVLHPPEPDWERQRVRNDDSVVMEVRYGDVSIVLAGDIGAAIEESLATRLSDAPIRILKAAHHGSAGSSSEAWLAVARPAAVVFSCGRDNRYGHPAPAVLDRVRSHGASIFRTDQDGAITVTTDGRSASVTTFTGRRAEITGHRR